MTSLLLTTASAVAIAIAVVLGVINRQPYELIRLLQETLIVVAFICAGLSAWCLWRFLRSVYLSAIQLGASALLMLLDLSLFALCGMGVLALLSH
jgi:high-affinity Fe2+/Pb2+ permease